MLHEYQEGDAVIVQTKHYGPYYGIVGAVDPDGSIVVRHNLKRYPGHPSGATYVCAKYLGRDVTRVNENIWKPWHDVEIGEIFMTEHGYTYQKKTTRTAYCFTEKRPFTFTKHCMCKIGGHFGC